MCWHKEKKIYFIIISSSIISSSITIISISINQGNFN